MLQSQRRPTEPGDILREHYLKPRGVTVTAFAGAVECSRKHISNILNGHARIEADLATRMARVLGTTPQLWLNLQNASDLYEAEHRRRAWQPAQVFGEENTEWAGH